MPADQLSDETTTSRQDIAALILADPDPIVAMMVYLYDTIPLSVPEQLDPGSEDSAG